MDSLWQLILFLEIGPKEIMRDEVGDLYAHMFITALLIRTKCQKQIKISSKRDRVQ